MRRLGSISLLLVFALTMIQPIIPHVLFQSNRGYIGKQLCEQRAVSGSKCNGSCYLSKQLKADQGDQKGYANSEIEFDIDLQYCISLEKSGLAPSLQAPGFLHAELERMDQFYSEVVIPPPRISALSCQASQA